jgi:hypothetical protein
MTQDENAGLLGIFLGNLFRNGPPGNLHHVVFARKQVGKLKQTRYRVKIRHNPRRIDTHIQDPGFHPIEQFRVGPQFPAVKNIHFDAVLASFGDDLGKFPRGDGVRVIRRSHHPDLQGEINGRTRRSPQKDDQNSQNHDKHSFHGVPPLNESDGIVPIGI